LDAEQSLMRVRLVSVMIPVARKNSRETLKYLANLYDTSFSVSVLRYVPVLYGSVSRLEHYTGCPISSGEFSRVWTFVLNRRADRK